MRIFGIDFSSSPTRRKPIVVAEATLSGPLSERARPQSWRLTVRSFESVFSLDEFSAWLRRPGPWTGGFDFPFALPRELLKTLSWPPYEADRMHESGVAVDVASAAGAVAGTQNAPDAGNEWVRHVGHLASLSRAQMVSAFKSFCDARPAGGKFAHRACDIPAGASPSMKWVNPPVAFMLHAGATRLHEAGVHLPGLKPGDVQRVALEAYPGYLARMVLGRESYKSDDRAKQTAARLAARQRLLHSLLSGPLGDIGLRQAQGLDLMIECHEDLRLACIDDASGDHIDALLCCVQASVGVVRQLQDSTSHYGMGAIDPLEGWIVSVMPGPDHHEKEC